MFYNNNIFGTQHLDKVTYPVATTPLVAQVGIDMNGVEVLANIPSPRHQVIRRTDTQQIIAIVSDKYKLVPNDTFLDSILQGIGQADIGFSSVDECHSLNGGRGFQAKFSFPELELIPNVDKMPIRYVLEVGGSYDTTRRLWFKAGAFREICTNGMYIGEIDLSVTERHVGNILETLKDLQRGITNVLHDAKTQMRDSLQPILEGVYEKSSATYSLISRMHNLEHDHSYFQNQPIKDAVPTGWSSATRVSLCEHLNDTDMGTPWEQYNQLTDWSTRYEPSRGPRTSAPRRSSLQKDVYQLMLSTLEVAA
jgi:hypothetical protein